MGRSGGVHVNLRKQKKLLQVQLREGKSGPQLARMSFAPSHFLYHIIDSGTLRHTCPHVNAFDWKRRWRSFKQLKSMHVVYANVPSMHLTCLGNGPSKTPELLLYTMLLAGTCTYGSNGLRTTIRNVEQASWS